MDLSALRQQVMFQIGGDAGDVQDFLPYLNDYINEAYDRLVMAAYGKHVCPEDERFQPLTYELSRPHLPAWTHRAIADWATWLVCRNGSAQRQNRGYAFRKAFLDVESRLRGSQKQIHNIPL